MTICCCIKNWNHHFEYNKSRDRERCSFACHPNNLGGQGYGTPPHGETLVPSVVEQRALESATAIPVRAKITIKLIFMSLWFGWLAGGNGRKRTEVAPVKDFVGESPELPSVEEAIEMVMSAGIPDRFVRRVYQDWVSRYGKDAGRASIRVVPYVAKRWVWESVKFTARIALAQRKFAHDTEVVKKLQFEAALCALKQYSEENGEGLSHE